MNECSHTYTYTPTQTHITKPNSGTLFLITRIATDELNMNNNFATTNLFDITHMYAVHTNPFAQRLKDSIFFSYRHFAYISIEALVFVANPPALGKGNDLKLAIVTSLDYIDSF